MRGTNKDKAWLYRQSIHQERFLQKRKKKVQKKQNSLTCNVPKKITVSATPLITLELELTTSGSVLDCNPVHTLAFNSWSSICDTNPRGLKQKSARNNAYFCVSHFASIHGFWNSDLRPIYTERDHHQERDHCDFPLESSHEPLFIQNAVIRAVKVTPSPSYMKTNWLADKK